ncbi:uncharacterized protein BDFB_013164 [Asbolus verrucosus]|uniref:Protein takeout n=1 Tax=Asbolus verrucosus TaxID=1661398 RepID=A0A482VAI5_ASBVE|nr:uncharacterized protein BDFB_013164 [Asbolus verrucosus]
MTKNSFKRCHKSDPHFDACLVVNIEDAIHKLKNGAPELGLDSFEPLLISELVIGEGSGPVNVQQNFKNVRLHGLTGSKVLGHKASLDENVLFAQSVTPTLRLEADYDMKGRVLLLPIYGQGPCNVTLVNTKINHTLHGELFDRKGKTYMKFVNYTVTLRPEIVRFHFANLFNGDDRLGDEINKVINDNWSEVFTDVRDGYERSFGLIFQDLANRVFTRVPLKDIYLD